ncbi:MAG: hypothetical protein FWE84_06150 [Firmicutes bacterium]|nr:hypothetical protein [Bacillota bacterium]
MKKKILAVVLAMLIVFSFVGCADIALAQYKDFTKRELDAYFAVLDKDDYNEDSWAEIERIVADGSMAINMTTDKERADFALNEAKQAIYAVLTELAKYKAAAKIALENYAENKGQENYGEENWATIQDIVMGGKITINAATDNDGVDLALNAAKQEIDAVWTELAEYKVAAKETLGIYAENKGQENYTRYYWDFMTVSVTNYGKNIDAAADKAEVDLLFEEAKSMIDQRPQKDFWELKEAYDKGWLSREDLMHITYFNTGEVVEVIENPYRLIKIDFTPEMEAPALDSSTKSELEDTFRSYLHQMDYRLSTAIADKFLGEYNGCYVVQFRFTNGWSEPMVRTLFIGGIRFQWTGVGVFGVMVYKK